MSDFAWPVLLDPASSRLEIIDSAGRFASPLNGYTRTVSRPGERMRLSYTFQNLNDQRRAALQSFVAGLRGAVHRVLAYDHANRIRGSFPDDELLTNNTFASGTTGWTSLLGADTAVTAADRKLRLRRIANTGGGLLFAGQAVSGLTQYAPYVARVMTDAIFGINGSFGASTSFGGVITTDFATSTGLRAAVSVVLATSGNFYIDQTGSTNEVAGALREVPYASLSRCALVDNGPNALLHSKDFSNAAWTKTRSSIAATAVTLPDGSSGTVNVLHEDSSAATTHYVSQGITVSSAAADFCFAAAIKAGNRTWARVYVEEGTGLTAMTAMINLATGALGTLTTGGNWSNVRAFSRSMGNGWYYVAVVGRKTNAATGLQALLLIGEGDNDVTFTGLNQDSIYLYDATLAQSSVPVKLTRTTTTALPTGASQSLAGGLNTKGWPASTDGLLLPGDQVQIGNQLLFVIAPVNSDAAGLASLHTAPTLRSAPADNAAVVINQPMGKFFLDADVNGWSNKPGIFSDADIVLSEAA